MKVWRRSKGELGLTLMELVVVSGILALLSTIVGLSVSGRGAQSRSATQVSDEATVQRAMDRYAAEHPQDRYPTLNGCLADLVLDLVTLGYVEPGKEVSAGKVDTGNLQFEFHEESSGADLNGDGDTDDSYTVVPIIWFKGFTARSPISSAQEVKRFSGFGEKPDELGKFLPRVPKHGFEFNLVGGVVDFTWEDGLNLDPDKLGNIEGNPLLITAPSGVGPGANGIDVTTGQVPTWVIGVFRPDQGIQAQNILPQTRY